MSQTFLHVPQLHWIVVEDSPHKTPLVSDLLVKSGLTYTHLHMPTAKDRKLQEVGRDVGDLWRHKSSVLPVFVLDGNAIFAISYSVFFLI